MKFPNLPAGAALTGAEIVPLTQSGADARTTSQAIADLVRGTKGADIASATTTDIGAATGLFVHVTGTTTITGLGTVAAGVLRIVEFAGALLLTYNATSLILPTAANITTAAGDCAIFVSEGSGNWRCTHYARANGLPLAIGSATIAMSASINEAQGADIASGSTTDIGAATGNYVHVTGTTTITSFGTVQAGTRRVVEFTGTLTITHNATSLILPGAANITTSAGDCGVFESEGSGNWRCVSFMYAAGHPGYKNIPQNSQSAAYTTVMADGGKHIYHPAADTTARTWTIDSNANVPYPIGTTITFDNDFGAGVVTIAITSDTLVLVGTSGSTGSRTLASGGQATAMKVSATRWRIAGTGLT